MTDNKDNQGFSLWSADNECWKCEKESKVYALSESGDKLLFNISSLSNEAVNTLTDISKTFYLDRSSMADTSYFMNHCEHCGAKIGDFYLHMEPDGGFFPGNPVNKLKTYPISLKAIMDSV
jgi:hypothetical protein